MLPIEEMDAKKIKIEKLPKGIGDLSAHFKFGFENSGVMRDGVVYTVKTIPSYDEKQITLGDIMDTGDVDDKYFIPEEKLYYTCPECEGSPLEGWENVFFINWD